MSVVTETIELQATAPHSTLRPSYGKSSFEAPESSRLSIATRDRHHVSTGLTTDSPNAGLASVSSSDIPTTSLLRTTLTIGQPSLINFLVSFTNGLITVSLPTIAASIDLPRALYLWPSSVYGLTSGSLLLIAGSTCDILGPRRVELFGILLLGAITLACGFSATGVQLVVFRALQGVATAMHLPASVAIVAGAVPKGRARNIGFACLGLSQPLGFSVGLVVSGILVENVGWRSGFWMAGGAMLVAGACSYWTIPDVGRKVIRQGESVLSKMWREIDWVGGLIASGGLAILAYVLAILSASLSTIRTPTTIGLLVTSIVLLISFPFWQHSRTSRNLPALIPNALWKNIPFTSTCIMVALAWGVMNSMELFSSLYFQEVQSHSPLTTSLYLLPNLLTGVAINLTIGFIVDRVPARILVVVSSFICALAPLFMAVVDPGWTYWYMQFWAQVFAPWSGDCLFTVGLIIVSESFPDEDQGIAGAVFNTVAQFGMSLGMGVCQVVALGVMGKDGGAGHGGGEAGGKSEDDVRDTLMGYRAGFWTMFAMMIVCGFIAVVGLKRAGKVGVKKD